MFSMNLENSPRFQATDVTSIINMMGKMKLQCMRIVIVTEQNIEKVFSTIKKNIFLNSWETKTLKLAKMAFIGQETVRKQQRHNVLWRMYTLIAVFVHFNRFIDLKINFHTNPYNLLPVRCCDSGLPVISTMRILVTRSYMREFFWKELLLS